MGKQLLSLALNEKAAEEVEKYGQDYPSYLTVGLSYRNPRIHDKLMSSAELAAFIRDKGGYYWWDLYDDGALHASAYSGNDMW